MKYTKETTDKMIELYKSGSSTADIALALTLNLNEPVPERSVIAKLASLGEYKKKEYLTKRGERPIKKEEYVEMIANQLGVNVELLESLEKANKNVLDMLHKALSKPTEAEED